MFHHIVYKAQEGGEVHKKKGREIYVLLMNVILNIKIFLIVSHSTTTFSMLHKNLKDLEMSFQIHSSLSKVVPK